MPDAVPVIDLAPFLSGHDCGRVARAIDAACRELGFLIVTGHRVPAADIARMHTTAAAFFGRPEDEKRRVQVPAGQIHGWTGAGRSRLADTLQAPGGEGAPPDLKETFSIGPLDTPPDVSPQEAPYFGRNLWPPQPAGLRDAARVYYRHMEILAATLMRAMAAGLGLDDRWRSTLHRVVNPPAARAGLARQSITFFHQPNWHTVVKCLPGCGDGRYAPMTSGAHFEAKLARLCGTPPAPSADQA